MKNGSPKLPTVGEAVNYTRCHARWQGHRWDDAPPPPTAQPVSPGWGRVSFRCERCGMQKHYEVSLRNGSCSRPRYTHRPKDYTATSPTKGDDWRLLFVAQFSGVAA